MPTVNQSVRAYLQARLPRHNGSDLLDRVLRYLPALEIQVNVLAGNGEPVAGKRSTYTDGVNEWWNIRIPKNANSEPEWRDYEIRWPLDDHAEGIGSTGWDWQAKRSRWVGFDIDSITNHAPGVGITDDELANVKKAAEALPYVEVRKSTGGNGLHFYVYFDDDGVPTENHTVHAALARAVLGMMSSATGFDFATRIDTCGGNMWVWHRKMTGENQGLALIKPADRILTAADLPEDWRELVLIHKSATRVNADTDAEQDPFEQLSSSFAQIPLDAVHKGVIEALSRSRFSTIWQPDSHLLQTHTKALQDLMDDPDSQKELRLKGTFTTITEGKDPATCNCFCVPLLCGGWRVYRFSPGTAEDESWDQDGQGWTHTEFNVPTDLDTAATKAGATPHPKGGYVFDTFDDAKNALQVAGGDFTRPEVEDRNVRVKLHKDKKRYVVEMAAQDHDPDHLSGWIREPKTKWSQVVNTDRSDHPASKTKSLDIVRHLISPADKGIGFVAWIRNRWVEQARDNCRLLLVAAGYTRADADAMLGNAIGNARILVDVPFGPEFPTSDQWNLFGARLQCQPTERGQSLSYPHFQMVLDHCGESLTLAVQQDPWCCKHELRNGADYLFHWAASVFQQPQQMLPWLFFYGKQNSGKSAFHEMLEVLVTKGYRKIDKVFTRDSTFSGELAGTILGIVEEADLTRRPLKAYNMLKDLIGSLNTTIEKKGWDAYDTRNYCHVVQTANKMLACPILEEDDSRVTVIPCDVIPESTRLPKEKLRKLWVNEAPDFLRAILDLKLPEPDLGDDRLFLPALWTPAKWSIIAGMAKVNETEPSQRPAVVLAQEIGPHIHFMAAAGWIIRKTATEILDGLQWLKVENLPDSPEEIGQAIPHINRDGLIFDNGKSGSRRWLTIATPRAMAIHKWCEKLREPKWSEEEIYAEVISTAGMPGI